MGDRRLLCLLASAGMVTLRLNGAGGLSTDLLVISAAAGWGVLQVRYTWYILVLYSSLRVSDVYSTVAIYRLNATLVYMLLTGSRAAITVNWCYLARLLRTEMLEVKWGRRPWWTCNNSWHSALFLMKVPYVWITVHFYLRAKFRTMKSAPVCYKDIVVLKISVNFSVMLILDAQNSYTKTFH